ncbi:hypothetical protein OM416_06565 [Paenibacillus sp. LS1]|nr:hypothetical protein [Paenibacillus sp. LS1]
MRTITLEAKYMSSVLSVQPLSRFRTLFRYEPAFIYEWGMPDEDYHWTTKAGTAFAAA